MGKILFIALCLSMFIVSAASGHSQRPDMAALRSQTAKMMKGGEDVATEDLPDRWQHLTQEHALQPSAEMSATSLNHLLQGKYIYSSTGARFDFILGMTDVQSAIGEFNFDGQGRFTGLQISRTVFTDRTSFSFAGSYTLDTSGGGFLFFPNETESIVVVNGGDAFFFVDLNSSNFREAGYARRF